MKKSNNKEGDMELDKEFEIIEINKPENAFRTFKKFRPDLVFLDISMPNITGFEILEDIKKSGIDTKVVMLSAFGNKRNVLKSFELGACDFIVKPFKKDQIIKYIEKYLFDN